MSHKFGIDRLAEQAAEHARSVVYETVEEISADSEIERLLALALIIRVWIGAQEHIGAGILDIDDGPPPNPTEFQRLFLFVKRQVQIADVGRVDFVIYAYDSTPRILKSPGWRKLIVECDGHDFHERTKDQAKRDRSRDRRAILGGIEVMRFTGSEIWNDPWGCAGDILDWAVRSWG